MSDFFSATPLALNTAREMLAKLRSVPGLGERYADIVSLDSLEDLVHVPLMRKDDLNVALEFLKPKAQHGATWTFQSGGSTGSPKLGYAPTGLYMAEVYEQWKPLGPDDIFVNGWGAGKLWGAHYLMGAYADLPAAPASASAPSTGPSTTSGWSSSPTATSPRSAVRPACSARSSAAPARSASSCRTCGRCCG